MQATMTCSSITASVIPRAEHEHYSTIRDPKHDNGTKCCYTAKLCSQPAVLLDVLFRCSEGAVSSLGDHVLK